MARIGGVTELYGDGPVSFKSAGALTLPASGSILVESTATATVGVAGDASLKVQGALLEGCTAAADIVDVMGEGYFLMTASGAITAGDPLAAAAGGKVRKWVAADTVPALIGRALDDIADTAVGRCYIDTI